MNKLNTFLIGSLLLLAVVTAASLEIDSNHVFEGEDFVVIYAASAPLSQQEVQISFAEQIQTITLPTTTVGTFSSQVVFTAPTKGTYEVVSGEARATIEVEPALVVLKELRLKPGSIAPRETSTLSYTIENEGQLRVYNVKSKITIPSSDKFSYNSDEQELFSVMAPGEKITQSKEIRARETAEGETNVEVVVTYEYDGETHTREEWVKLGVNSMDFALIFVVLLLLVVVAKFFFSRGQGISK